MMLSESLKLKDMVFRGQKQNLTIPNASVFGIDSIKAPSHFTGLVTYPDT